MAAIPIRSMLAMLVALCILVGFRFERKFFGTFTDAIVGIDDTAVHFVVDEKSQVPTTLKLGTSQNATTTKNDNSRSGDHQRRKEQEQDNPDEIAVNENNGDIPPVNNLYKDAEISTTTATETRRDLSTSGDGDEETTDKETAMDEASSNNVIITATSISTSTIQNSPSTVSSFSMEKPLFVVSLPNSANLVIPRYFKCAGVPAETIGQYWDKYSPKEYRQPIGACMAKNMMKVITGIDNPLLTTGCGHGQYQVWTDLQELQGPILRGKHRKPSGCFDIVLFPKALEQLGASYPHGATILNVVRDPVEWYTTLSQDFPRYWNEWCNPTHGAGTFPVNNTRDAYIAFYQRYQERIRTFMASQQHLKYIEIDLQQSPATNAQLLQDQLGIAASCWTTSYTATLPKLDDPKAPPVPDNQPLPNDLRFPILVTSLPKSGTTSAHDYFFCSMGKWSSAHQQVLNLTNTRLTSIGQCMQHNTKYNKPFLQDCGFARVFSDVGIFSTPLCYYPTLHGGLEEFAKSYPYGTILNVVRNSTKWYDSAMRWRNFPHRWSGSNPMCGNVFPPKHSSPDAWVDFYDSHNQRIRDFAKAHPTLTYLEVPLALTTGHILEYAFGFNPACWHQANVNTGDKKGKKAKMESTGKVTTQQE